jgi:hypothetical protein
MTSRWTVAPLVAVCLWASPLLAADGVLLVQQVNNGSGATTAQVQLEKTRMRADTVGPMGEKMAVIFDAGRQVLQMVNYDMKSYTEMTKADVDRLGGQMNAAMAQMEEAMKNMPPAQRAQMEAMMRGRGIGPAAAAGPRARPQFRKTGTDTVGTWTCDKYEGYQNNQKVQDLCTVDPKVLNLTAADLDVSRQLVAFLEAVIPQSAGAVFRIGSDDQGFTGVPVRSVNTVAGRQIVSELKEVTRQNFADSTFAVPEGFQKQQMPTMPGRGGRQ